VSVSVILPTFRRPEGLRAALQSVLGQSRAPDELIIVDNAPEKSAERAAASANAVAPFPVHYVHAPEPGVANARNAAMKRASGRYLAFLDDDEIAVPDWLDALLTTAREQEASVVFGPLQGEALGLEGMRRRFAERLYSRPGPDRDALLDEPYGCGNSLVDRDAFDLPDAPFDPALNESGGEDDAFFADLAEQGARFAWSSRARAREVVDPARTRWRYLLARAFAFGQGPSQAAARAGQLPRLAFWMGVGLGQMAVYTPLAGLAALMKTEHAAELLDKAVQGAGKLAWFDGLEPKFYGAATPGAD